MTAPKLTYIPDILEEHFEELAFLWGQRMVALRSPAYSWKKFAALEERIEAHVQGLLAVGSRLREFATPFLTSEEASEAFAAGYALLRMRTESATQHVLSAFTTAKGSQLEGLKQALCHGLRRRFLVRLHDLVRPLGTPLSAAAAEILAFHGVADTRAADLEILLGHGDPEIQRAGWRIAALSGVLVSPHTYASTMKSADAGVRHEAMIAAAWQGQTGLLVVLRCYVGNLDEKNWDAMLLLAILGQPEDLERILAIGDAAALGPRRFQALGAFGHPCVVDALLAAVENPDPGCAAAAGAAFTKITGADIRSGKRAEVPAEGGGESDFDKEFQEVVVLPDPGRARQHWQSVRVNFASATRVCGGFALGASVDPGVLDQLDMESRRQALFRGRFEGAWNGKPAELERFPMTGARRPA